MTLRRLDAEQYSVVYRWAKRRRILGPSDSSAVFVDFDVLDERLEHLRTCFPEGTLHAIAIKTNPLLGVLRHLVSRGFGLEAASFEEVLLAKRAGVSNDRLVWDSPAKRRSEIEYCDQHFPGLLVNANCLEELPRLSGCRNLRVGLRVNPMIDAGSPGLMAVSRDDSKFGEPIRHADQIVAAFQSIPTLVGLHVHVGSDMRHLDNAATAVAAVMALADEVDRQSLRAGRGARIEFVDIGGGIPAEYGPAAQIGLDNYLLALSRAAPGFGNRSMITEFGRFVHAHAGWLVTDIEYSFERNGAKTHVLHLGADMFVREVYWPDAPRHQCFPIDKSGHLKDGPLQRCSLAGPLCFAGDMLSRDSMLPAMEPGDRVVVADVGANTFALWSRHCSRSFPKVIGYSARRNEMGLLKRRESPARATSLWS